MSLASARKAAAAIMGEVAAGRSPAAERKQVALTARAKALQERYTLRKLIEDWERLHLVSRRPRYAQEAVRALKRSFAQSLDQSADLLDRTTVVRALDALRGRKKGSEDQSLRNARLRGSAMARNCAAYGRAAFSWAMKRGNVSCNPFEGLPVSMSSIKRDRVLEDGELMRIWQVVRNAATAFDCIVFLLILTGQRREEVASMRWNELSPDLTVWTKPGRRTKNSVPHIVPLSDTARAIIRRQLPKKDNEAWTALSERRNTGALVFAEVGSDAFSGWSKSKATTGCLIRYRGLDAPRLATDFRNWIAAIGHSPRSHRGNPQSLQWLPERYCGCLPET
jgi:integrase